MSRLSALIVLAVCSPSALGEEIPTRIRDLANKEFGERFARVSGKRKVSDLVRSVCPACEFYSVQLRSKWAGEPGMPPGIAHHRLDYLAVGPKHAVGVRTPEDVARFLDRLRIPVRDELGALRRAFVFADLVGGKARTGVPAKKSLFKQYQTQKQEDWDLKLSATASGWHIALTLMVDSGIEYCVRFRLRIERTGAVSIADQRLVYTYSMYE